MLLKLVLNAIEGVGRLFYKGFKLIVILPTGDCVSIFVRKIHILFPSIDQIEGLDILIIKDPKICLHSQSIMHGKLIGARYAVLEVRNRLAKFKCVPIIVQI